MSQQYNVATKKVNEILGHIKKSIVFQEGGANSPFVPRQTISGRLGSLPDVTI